MPAPNAVVRAPVNIRETPQSFALSEALGNVFDQISASFGGKSKDIANNSITELKPALFSQDFRPHLPPQSLNETLENNKKINHDDPMALREAFHDILNAQIRELHQGQPVNPEAFGVLVKISNNLGSEGQILMQSAHSQIEEARRDPGQIQERGLEHG